MTTQEAKQKLNQCENQITNTYSNLRNAARTVGSSAVETAANKTTTKTLIPLIISLFGFILMCASHPGWGIVLIIVGAVIAYNTHSTAKSIQTTIENQQKNLNEIIDRNNTI